MAAGPLGRSAVRALRDRARALGHLPGEQPPLHPRGCALGHRLGRFRRRLALLLLGVAVSAWRRSPWLEGVATAAAALLVVDAWFDILTSSTHVELAIAIGEAVLVELPLAVLCVLLARDAERVLRPRTPT